ncbi:hypothetical protein [Polaromonas sp. A23]|uniref:hypothetical protein n=1 Tax=Polaromonas sp. A23 TaxID=1944133 RepID=UPI00111565A5|nr:hypothetical protein [Polaromonas sp. A23]
MDIYTKSPVIGEQPLEGGVLNLRISGFSSQAIVSIADIVSAVDALPGHHLKGLREIVYAPYLSSTLRSLYTGRPGYSPKAEFIQRERKIIFYDLCGYDLFHHILYHEIGHFVFFLALNSQVKKRWVTKIFPQSPCITDYGALNACEDFSETYASYMCNAEALKKFPRKYEFMREFVFSGRRETFKEKNCSP